MHGEPEHSYHDSDDPPLTDFYAVGFLSQAGKRNIIFLTGERMERLVSLFIGPWLRQRATIEERLNNLESRTLPDTERYILRTVRKHFERFWDDLQALAVAQAELELTVPDLKTYVDTVKEQLKDMWQVIDQYSCRLARLKDDLDTMEQAWTSLLDKFDVRLTRLEHSLATYMQKTDSLLRMQAIILQRLNRLDRLGDIAGPSH